MVPYNTAVVTDLIVSQLAKQHRGAQARLARAMGVTPQTVNKWVKGQTCPEPDRWEQLEKALGLEDGTIAQKSGLGQPIIDLDLETRFASIDERFSRVEEALARLERSRRR